jgi:hypothetical protein
VEYCRAALNTKRQKTKEAFRFSISKDSVMIHLSQMARHAVVRSMFGNGCVEIPSQGGDKKGSGFKVRVSEFFPAAGACGSVQKNTPVFAFLKSVAPIGERFRV